MSERSSSVSGRGEGEERSIGDAVLTHRLDRRSFMTRAALVGAAAATAPALIGAGPRPGKGPKVVPPPFAVNPLLSARHRITRHEVSAVNPDEGPVHLYLAMPADVASAPGVLVIQENRGLQPYQRDIVDGLASNGYIAVAPDLLSHDGGAGIVSHDDAPSTLNAAGNDRHIADLIASIDRLRNQPEFETREVGVIGFCFGGSLSWEMAIRSEALGLSAAIPCYGSASDDIIAAARNGAISAAVFAAYAEDDSRVNATRADILAAMEEGGTTFDTRTYPGTRHAFHNHTREDRYNAKQAQNLWEDALDWFGQHLN